MEISPSEGAIGGALDLTVQSPPRAPPAPLDQKAKKGVKGNSSGPPKDQKSDVSKKTLTTNPLIKVPKVKSIPIENK